MTYEYRFCRCYSDDELEYALAEHEKAGWKVHTVLPHEINDEMSIIVLFERCKL